MALKLPNVVKHEIDRALAKIMQDRLRAVPMPADIREKLAAMRGKQ